MSSLDTLSRGADTHSLDENCTLKLSYTLTVAPNLYPPVPGESSAWMKKANGPKN